MGLFGSFRKSATQPAPGLDAPCRRRAERHQTAVLSCILGEVKDLSVSGMRISARSAPPVPMGMLFEFDLQSPADTVTVVGRVVRAVKLKGGGFDIGVEFQRLTPETAAAIDSLARHGVIKNKRPARGASPSGGPAQESSGRAVSARVQIPDLYAALGVPPDADADRIQAAFRALAREYHPDVNKSDAAQAKFVELLKAYDVLRDPDSRRAYDTARLKAA